MDTLERTILVLHYAFRFHYGDVHHQQLVTELERGGLNYVDAIVAGKRARLINEMGAGYLDRDDFESEQTVWYELADVNDIAMLARKIEHGETVSRQQDAVR